MTVTPATTSLWITETLYGVAAINLGLAALVAYAGIERSGIERKGKTSAGTKETIKASIGKQEQTRVFALTLLCVALWAWSNAQFGQTDSISSAKLWAKFSYLPALLTAASFFHFSRVFPRYTPLSPTHKLSIYLAAIVIGALAFVPDLMVREVVQDGANRRLLTGSGLYLVAIYMLSASAMAFALFWRNQGRLKGRYQAQARYVLFGSSLTALIGLGCNLLLPLFGDYRFVNFGPTGSLFVVSFTVYSILVHRLFDIRILIRRTFVYTLYAAAFAGTFAALGKTLELFISPLMTSLLRGDHPYINGAIAALVVGSLLDPLKRQLHQLASQHLFKGELEESREPIDD